VAYEVIGDGIRLVHADGSGDHPLKAGDLVGAQHPSWSADGQWLTFVLPDANDVFDIWIARADGSEAQKVFDCEAPCADADGPAFSPESSSRIAFRVFDQVDGAFPGSRIQMLTVGPLAGNSRTLAVTTTPEYIGNGTPVRWSPEGMWIVYDISTIVDPGTEHERVVESRIATSRVTPKGEPFALTDLATFPTYADWSPANEIVFMARSPVASDPDESPFNLFTITNVGESIRQLTEFNRGGVWGPTWSPSGQSIWVTITEPEWHLGWVDAATGDVHEVPGPILGAHPREQPTP
jgi:Tol biopolymer transport system component